ARLRSGRDRRFQPSPRFLRGCPRSRRAPPRAGARGRGLGGHAPDGRSAGHGRGGEESPRRVSRRSVRRGHGVGFLGSRRRLPRHSLSRRSLDQRPGRRGSAGLPGRLHGRGRSDPPRCRGRPRARPPFEDPGPRPVAPQDPRLRQGALPLPRAVPRGRLLMASLEDLLEKTSRTFALSIPVLPEPTKRQVMIAYLLFRIADTFEDASHWSPALRIEALREFRDLLSDYTPAEASRLAAKWTGNGPSPNPGYRELIEETPLILEAFFALDPEAVPSVREHV